MRAPVDFRTPKTLNTLYTTLVLPHLEYCSNLWNPCRICHIKSLDSIQPRYLRYAACKLHIPFDRFSHNYEHILSTLGYIPLEKRRLLSDLILTLKVINHHVKYPELLSLFELNVPPRVLRNTPLFMLRKHSTTFGMNNCVDRLCRTSNSVAHLVDFFCHSLYSFKRSANKAVNSSR